jgi:hypothetical protein
MKTIENGQQQKLNIKNYLLIKYLLNAGTLLQLILVPWKSTEKIHIKQSDMTSKTLETRLRSHAVMKNMQNKQSLCESS